MFKKLFTGVAAAACLLSAALPIKSNAANSMHTSYYAHYFHGRTTANGERFNMFDLTAAHKPYRLVHDFVSAIQAAWTSVSTTGVHLSLADILICLMALLAVLVCWVQV
jgi:hypothetical protein